MNKLNRDELLKLAELSALKLGEDEIDPLLKDLDSILSYASQLENITLGERHKPTRNTNMLRDDVARSTDTAPLLAQAPEHADTYYVVPQIVDHDREEQA